MKHYKIQFIFGILLLINATAIAQSDQVTIPYNPETMSQGIEINLNFGDIKITGSDRTDIMVKYTFEQNQHMNKTEVNDDGLKRISISKASVEIETDDDMIRISSWDHNKFIDLIIEVPRNIHISTFKGGPGSLSIDNIIGNLNLENNSGSISATNIEGIINASTNEGDVTIGLNSIPTEKTMMIVNVIGDIEINLPKEHNTTFHMKTTNGELLTNLDLIMEESAAIKGASTNSPEGFSYTNNIWTDATLNGGGGQITLSSMSGNIIIKGQ